MAEAPLQDMRMDEKAKKRSTLRSMITTPPGGLGMAPTAMKTTLGM